MKHIVPLFLLLAASLAGAQEGTPDEQRRLVEQKMRLVEMLVNVQAAKSGTAVATDRLEKGRKALSLAREAVSENRFDAAEQILDEALRSSSSGSRGVPQSTLSEDALRNAYQNLIEQVATYRASVEDVATDPKIGSAARVLLTRIDGKSAEARQHATAGRFEQANRLLGEAYQLAVSELSRLRSGDEIVHSLNFASPVEEYAYEIKRFESNQILVNMMIGEGKAEGEKRSMIDGFLAEARRLRGEADERSKTGRHKDAVNLMENASGQLNRALQLMGVPVF